MNYNELKKAARKAGMQNVGKSNAAQMKSFLAKKEKPKAEKKTTKQKFEPIIESNAMESVKKMQCKKHIKIWKLKQLDLDNKVIAKELGTNVGHVWNVLNNYKTKPGYIDKANLI